MYTIHTKAVNSAILFVPLWQHTWYNHICLKNVLSPQLNHPYKYMCIIHTVSKFSNFVCTSVTAHMRAMEPMLLVMVTRVALARSSLVTSLRRCLHIMWPKLHTQLKSKGPALCTQITYGTSYDQKLNTTSVNRSLCTAYKAYCVWQIIWKKLHTQPQSTVLQ